jgi:Family of unknown function (DUF6489)
MKVTIEIDCTPDEARQFMGLPDVKPMQAAVMGRIEAQMTEAVERFSPDAMLRSWMSLMPQTPDQFKDVVGRFFKPPGSGVPSKGGS